MSATVVMTALAPTKLMAPDLSSSSTTSCCPNCGSSLPLLEQAQRQIDDLQSQVRLLNEKASAAVDRWADYEDELSRLRSALDSQQQQQQQQNQEDQQQQQRRSASTTPSTAPPTAASTPTRSSFLPPGFAAGRLSALLSPRKPLPAAPHGIDPGAATTEDLLTALSREQYLRKEAEGRLSETSREVEDLSVSLFEQANAMVAAERRARAKLEGRVEVLERRDWEKRGRLEKLEAALGSIERGRRVLGEPVPTLRVEEERGADADGPEAGLRGKEMA